MKFRSILSALALCAAANSQAALIHQYELNGDLKDAKGGPDLVANRGSVTAQGYSFLPNQGLALNEDLGGVYTIDLEFTFNGVAGWNKIVDFSDLKQVNGLYSHDTSLNLYSYTASGGQMAAGVSTRMTLTRDADSMFRIYQEGNLVMSVRDVYGYADFTGHYANFFRDEYDNNEAVAGFVDFIHVYDKALSQTEVDVLVNGAEAPLPEPASIALIGAGLGLLGLRKRRRA